MRKVAGNYWSKTENLNFVLTLDPFGSLVQLWTCIEVVFLTV